MNEGLRILKAIRQHSCRDPNRSYSELFAVLYETDLYHIAYGRVKSNLSTKKYKKIVFSKLSDSIIQDVIQQLRNDCYIFNQINHDMRGDLPIKILMDYVVQEVIGLLLEAIFAPLFTNDDLPSWSNYSPHVVLEKIEQNLPQSAWAIRTSFNPLQIDATKNQILSLLSQKIIDKKLLKLLDAVLQSLIGINRYNLHSLNQTMDISESYLSYVLLDIYYQPWDAFIISNLASIQLKTITRQSSDKNKVYTITQVELGNLKKSSSFQIANKNIIVYYIRYGHNCILLLNRKSTSQQALWIKNRIENFLYNNWKVEAKYFNLHGVNITKNSLVFLGYEISLQCNKAVFLLPMKHILNLLLDYKFILYNKNKGIRPTSQNKLLIKSDSDIVQHYNFILWNLRLYYSGISDSKQLGYIQYLLKFSCAMTLAHKHKSTVSKIFSLYGQDLTVKSFFSSKKVIQLQNYKDVSLFKWQNTQYFFDPFIRYK